MNKLINEEQNMMNFKDEIDVNENSTVNHYIMDNEEEERECKYKKTSSKSKINNTEYNNENKETDESIKQSKIKEEEDKEKNSYKSMFRLAQYLYYYRCKVEENMEMKKKNNRCFNYQLSEDLEELFID